MHKCRSRPKSPCPQFARKTDFQTRETALHPPTRERRYFYLTQKPPTRGPFPGKCHRAGTRGHPPPLTPAAGTDAPGRPPPAPQPPAAATPEGKRQPRGGEGCPPYLCISPRHLRRLAGTPAPRRRSTRRGRGSQPWPAGSPARFPARLRTASSTGDRTGKKTGGGRGAGRCQPGRGNAPPAARVSVAAPRSAEGGGPSPAAAATSPPQSAGSSPIAEAPPAGPASSASAAQARSRLPPAPRVPPGREGWRPPGCGRDAGWGSIAPRPGAARPPHGGHTREGAADRDRPGSPQHWQPRCAGPPPPPLPRRRGTGRVPGDGGVARAGRAGSARPRPRRRCHRHSLTRPRACACAPPATAAPRRRARPRAEPPAPALPLPLPLPRSLSPGPVPSPCLCPGLYPLAPAPAAPGILPREAVASAAGGPAAGSATPPCGCVPRLMKARLRRAPPATASYAVTRNAVKMRYLGKWCPGRGPTEAHTKGGVGGNSGGPGAHRGPPYLLVIDLQAVSSLRRREADLRPIFDIFCHRAADQPPPAPPAHQAAPSRSPSPPPSPQPSPQRAQPRPRADKTQRLVDPRTPRATTGASAAASPGARGRRGALPAATPGRYPL